MSGDINKVNPLPTQMAGYNPAQSYANAAIASTLDSDGLDYGLFANNSNMGMGMGMGGMMPGMMGSYGMGMGGMMPGMMGSYGMGMGAMKAFNEMTPQQLQEYQTSTMTNTQKTQQMLMANELENRSKLGQIQSKIQLEQVKNGEAYEYAVKAQKDAIANNVGILQNAIAENDQDRIKTTYAKLRLLAIEQLEEINATTDPISKEKVDRFTGKPIGKNEIPEDQIKARVAKLYYETTGKNLMEDFNSHSDSSFFYGAKKGFFGFGNLVDSDTNALSNRSSITGEITSKKQQRSEAFGFWAGVTGAVATVAAGIWAIGRKIRA